MANDVSCKHETSIVNVGIMAHPQGRSRASPLFRAILLIALASFAQASIGDRLTQFRSCLQVCELENCAPGEEHTPIPIHRRLLFWTCSSECNYACQHIVTEDRVASGYPVVQFYGKWPFYRFLGMQEPFSVLFSVGNLLVHLNGLRKVEGRIPVSYSLRPFYVWFARFNISAWIFSSIFHTRDFTATEQMDYFAAGATILYGMYYTPIRIFRLDIPTPRRRSVLRFWTLVCSMMYLCHVAYLKGVRWDYTYNMAANVVAGIVQNTMWTMFSVYRYRKSKRLWATWPGIVVAWLTFAMSMELFDFPPWAGAIDAHSLWHLFTIGPAILWYNFLVKDAQEDLAGSERLKS